MKTSPPLRTPAIPPPVRLAAALTVILFPVAGLRAAVPGVAVGNAHSLFLKSDGTVWAAGRNTEGELGDGTTFSRSSPVPVLEDVQAVAAGGLHSLFLKSDGTVWVTGDNISGQLGNGASPVIRQSSPVRLTGLSGLKAVAAGGEHSLFLKSDGTVWAAGSNIEGQLGNGASDGMERRTPVKLSTLSNVKAIAAGLFHSLFLKNDGTVWAAGGNAGGQLGDGTGTSRPAPVRIQSLTDIQAIAAGDYHSLFLKGDGTVWAVGANYWGGLGDGTREARSSPVRVPGVHDAQAVAAGGNGSVFLTRDGLVLATGAGWWGGSRDGSTTYRTVPARVPGLSGVRAVAAGYAHLFLKLDGSVWAAGANDFGQLGIGTQGYRPVPATIPGISGIQAVAAGSTNSLFLKTDGTVLSVGESAWKDDGGDRDHYPDPAPIQGLTGVKAMEVNNGCVLFLKEDHTVMALGSNAAGQFGNGSISGSAVPVPVPGLAGVRALSVGARHSVFLKTDGTVWATGRNSGGLLGDGTALDRTTPVRLTDLSDVEKISAGASGSLFLRRDGSLWVAGGLQSQFDSPASATTVNQVHLDGLPIRAFEARGERAVLLGVDGAAYITAAGFPHNLSDLAPAVEAVSSGDRHTLLLKTDGSVAAFGSNEYGQLGDGSMVDQQAQAPVPLPDPTGVRAVSAGATHSLFLKTDGTVMGAGLNTGGQLGLPNADKRAPVFTMLLTPAQVSAWQRRQFGAQAENPAVSGWDADPDGDGLANLLERAFNLSPLTAGTEALPAEGGTAGLPAVFARQKSGGTALAVRYLRLKVAAGPGMVYTPQFSSAPDREDSWAAAPAGVETVESIDADWERVTVEDSVTLSPPARFARVKVTMPVTGSP